MGMSVTVSEIDVPRRARSPTGSSRARASASRSRTSCVRSFVAWAMIRRMVGARWSSGGRPPLRPLVLLNDGEEDVLQRVVLLGDLEDADRLALETSGELACRGRGIALDDDVEAVAEERHAPGLHLGREDAGGARRLPRTDLEDAAALGGLHAARRALRHEFPGDHEAQAVALLRFLEVVRGDQDGRAPVRELVDHGPESPAGDGIDARGRLVEEENTRLVHHRRPEGHALLPAAGQAAGDLAAAVLEAGEGEDPSLPLFAALGRHAVDAGEEVQVLDDGEVVVQGELLGHVADPLPHALRAKPAAFAGQLDVPGGRLEEAAEHLDGRGLAGAVGAEETIDLTVAHLEIDARDGREAAEDLAEAARADGDGAVGSTVAAVAGERRDARLALETSQDRDEGVLERARRGPPAPLRGRRAPSRRDGRRSAGRRRSPRSPGAPTRPDGGRPRAPRCARGRGCRGARPGCRSGGRAPRASARRDDTARPRPGTGSPGGW